MIVTNGQIDYEHPHKVGDFQIPKARVSLSFVIPEGEDVDAALYKVGDLARAHAMRIAGGQMPVVKPPVEIELPPAVEQKPQASLTIAPNATIIPPQPAARPRGRPPKAVTTQAAPAPEPVYPDHSLPAATYDINDAFGTATAPVVHSPSPFVGNGATAAPATSTVVPPGASPSPASVDPSLLTDDALKKTLNAKAQAGTPVEKIKALIARFTGNPVLPIYSVTDPAKRAAFLAEVKEL